MRHEEGSNASSETIILKAVGHPGAEAGRPVVELFFRDTRPEV